MSPAEREVVQMALTALENVNCDSIYEQSCSVCNVIEALRTALAQPEPVAVWELEEDGWDTIADPEWMETLPVGTKLYTAPPQRKPLSDEQIIAIAKTEGQKLTLQKNPNIDIDFARAIEAAHGIG